MNYIKSLELENEELRIRLIDYARFMTELQAYMQSRKFHNDNLVNVNDILLRINEFKSQVYADVL
jgi:hypothetical protein